MGRRHLDRPGCRDRLAAAFEPSGLAPLAVLVGFSVADRLDGMAFRVLLPDIKDTHDLSTASLSLLFSAKSLVLLALLLPIGYLADHTNRLRLARAGALLWAASALVMASPVPGAVFFFAWFFTGVGSLANDVHYSLLSDYYSPSRFPGAVALHRNAAAIVMLVAGPAMAGLASRLESWRPVFAILAVPSLVMAVASMRISEPARGRFLDVPPHTRSERVPIGEAYRRLRAIATMRRLWVAAFLWGAAVVPLGAIVPLLLDEVYGVGRAGRGYVATLQIAAAIGGYTLGAWVAHRANRSGDSPRLVSAMTVFGMLYGASIFLMAALPWLLASVGMLAMSSVFAAALVPCYLALASLITPAAMRTLGFSFVSLYISLGGLLLSQVALQSGQVQGLRFSIGFLSLFVVAGGVVAATARRFVRSDIEGLARRQQAEEAAGSAGLLVCRDLHVAYENVVALSAVDLDVAEGDLVVILGTNGAGKSTLLNTVSGVTDPKSGSIFFAGRDITHAAPQQTASLGIVHVPGDRGVFASLTVEENLRVAAWARGVDSVPGAIAGAVELFPELAERARVAAGRLSGGEQRMLNLAMAFVARPRLLLVDELSTGLAASVAERVLDMLVRMHHDGTTVVVVEQSADAVLGVASKAVFLEKGHVRFAGDAHRLAGRGDLLRAVHLPSGGGAGVLESPARRFSSDTGAEADVSLSLRGVSKWFGPVCGVDGVDLDVRNEEIVAIVGPNGAGKTTLFDVVSGFVQPDRGSVLLLGRDVTSQPPWARARAGLGRSFQTPVLWRSLTVRETLEVACHSEMEPASPLLSIFKSVNSRSEAAVRQRIDGLIELLQLSYYEHAFFSELSSGLRRIVEIGTVLAAEPAVVLLDEPSAGLAAKEAEQLVPLLRSVRSRVGCSMLVVEHHMGVVAGLADRVVTMERGRLALAGTPVPTYE